MKKAYTKTKLASKWSLEGVKEQPYMSSSKLRMHPKMGVSTLGVVLTSAEPKADTV